MLTVYIVVSLLILIDVLCKWKTKSIPYISFRWNLIIFIITVLFWPLHLPLWLGFLVYDITKTLLRKAK